MTSGRRITVEADPRQRADRRACVSLLVLGILTLLMFGSMESAILREKRIKRWSRAWKYDLIHKDNPTWRDLAEDFGFPSLPLK